MLPVPFFFTMLAICCGYAWLRGGAPERAGAAIFAAAAVLSTILASPHPTRFASVEAGVLMVDLVMLLALVVLAIGAERFWPLWVAALQAVGAAAHVGRFAGHNVSGAAYAIVLALWSYPMLCLLALGTWRHQQRLKTFGSDRSWSRARAKPAGHQAARTISAPPTAEAEI
jgi:hypothetical protein